jgi:hypothetical protein
MSSGGGIVDGKSLSFSESLTPMWARYDCDELSSLALNDSVDKADSFWSSFMSFTTKHSWHTKSPNIRRPGTQYKQHE